MKDFSLRLISLIAIVLVLGNYNVTLAEREALEEEARLAAQAEAIEQGGGGGPYKDGVYTGASQGYGGMITVELTVENGYIKDVSIVSAPGEDSAYIGSASSLIPEMISAQTTSVDTVTGATMTSVGLINAASIALNEAI